MTGHVLAVRIIQSLETSSYVLFLSTVHFVLFVETQAKLYSPLSPGQNKNKNKKEVYELTVSSRSDGRWIFQETSISCPLNFLLEIKAARYFISNVITTASSPPASDLKTEHKLKLQINNNNPAVLFHSLPIRGPPDKTQTVNLKQRYHRNGS